MYCPVCHVDYEPQFTHCADCGAKLFDRDYRSDDSSVAPLFLPNLIELRPFTGSYQAETILNILNCNNIEAFIVDNITHLAVDQSNLYNVTNASICVFEKDYERAKSCAGIQTFDNPFDDDLSSLDAYNDLEPSGEASDKSPIIYIISIIAAIALFCVIAKLL